MAKHNIKMHKRMKNEESIQNLAKKRKENESRKSVARIMQDKLDVEREWTDRK